jgi:preprotein translocase subunit SecE
MSDQKWTDNKWIHLLFATGGLVLAWLLAKTGDWVWSYFGKPNSFAITSGAVLVAAIVTFVAWRNEELFRLAGEVAQELGKVTWPTRKETFNSTIIVIVTTLIAAGILGVFDAVWSAASRAIYS